MKILHVTKKYPPVIGGDAIVVSNLQKEQQTAGHDVVVVTSNCEEVPNSPCVYKVGLRDTAAGLDTITFRRIVSLVILFFRMFSIVSRERPDVIHTHSVDMAFFASFAARMFSVPLVHTFHIVTFYDRTQPAIRRYTEMWLAKHVHSHRITAPNDFDVTKLREAGLSQAILLPNGVDTDFWMPPMNPPTNQRFEFLTVGRLERQKGYEYLIKAAALLAQTNIPFHITIVGEGTQRDTLSALAEHLNVKSNITFAGIETPEQIRILLHSADAAVFPSLYETTPLTLLEAWSAKVPVIVTPVGIMRDAPTDFDAAYIVPLKDEHALMQAMAQCISDKNTNASVASKGYAHAQKYAWSTIAQTAEKLYRGTD